MKKSGKSKNQPVIAFTEFRQLADKHSETDIEYRKMKAFYDIARATTGSLDLQETLEKALHELLDITSSDKGICYLLDADRGYTHSQTQEGFQKIKNIHPVGLGHEELRLLLQWKSPCQEPSEIVGPTTLQCLLKPLERTAEDPYLFVPFTGRSHMITLMLLGRKGVNIYTREDLALTGALGAESGVCFENALAFENVSRLATRDMLTELYNQNFFLQRLNEEVERSARYGQKCSFIMLELIDLDVFNNIMGHPCGEATLKE
jgi:GGDEF domain-containing protein